MQDKEMTVPEKCTQDPLQLLAQICAWQAGFEGDMTFQQL